MLISKFDCKELGVPIIRSDIRIIIEINGVKIGIESQGDPNSRLEDSLDLFVKMDCQIIVCATRTGGMTVEWVNTTAEQHSYEIEWIEKKSIKEPTNSEVVKKIVSEIEKLLNKNSSSTI